VQSASDLLTEAEVALRLRCSPSKVKRLRLAGKLAYLPGRPVMIREAAVAAYEDVAECQPQHPTFAAPLPGSIMSTGRKTESESVSALAKRLWERRRNSLAPGF
jgi:hypothetical protein